MLHISLAAEPVFYLGSFAITNAMFTSLIASALIIGIFWLAARHLVLRPTSKLTLAVEAGCEALINLIESVTHSRKQAVQFFPLLATLFIFIVINNWIGLLPGVGPITITTDHGTVPLFRGANADLNTTLALAILTMVLVHVYAVRELGILRHLSKYFSKNPIFSAVGLLEIVSEFSKIISFSFRLFGNVFAGEVLLVVIAYLAPILGPLPFFGLEIFVGLVQGLVFTMLALVFLATASSDHSEDSHEPAPEIPQTTEATQLINVARPVETVVHE